MAAASSADAIMRAQLLALLGVHRLLSSGCISVSDAGCGMPRRLICATPSASPKYVMAAMLFGVVACAVPHSWRHAWRFVPSGTCHPAQYPSPGRVRHPAAAQPHALGTVLRTRTADLVCCRYFSVRDGHRMVTRTGAAIIMVTGCVLLDRALRFRNRRC